VRLASGALWTVASRRSFAKGDPVLVTIRPEQLTLTGAASAETIPVSLKLSLPIGGELIHDIETAAGEAFKVASPRRPGASLELSSSMHCALAVHAKPILFPRPAA
jgi:putative spermidine/putrescine transport system ATP-binding protein